MDPAMLEAHLRRAEEHIALGEQHIARQHQIIADLERGGHDTAEAVRLLANFEDMQRLHSADRERIQNELRSVG